MKHPNCSIPCHMNVKPQLKQHSTFWGTTPAIYSSSTLLPSYWMQWYNPYTNELKSMEIFTYLHLQHHIYASHSRNNTFFFIKIRKLTHISTQFRCTTVPVMARVLSLSSRRELFCFLVAFLMKTSSTWKSSSVFSADCELKPLISSVGIQRRLISKKKTCA